MKKLFLAVAAVLSFACSSVLAQGYPAKTIALVVPTTAGSTTDVLARDVGRPLADRLGQPVIVENVVGAGNMIAIRKVIAARPDGYTLLFISNGVIASQAMKVDPGFDVTKDLLAVSPALEGFFGIYTNPEVPAKNLQEFIAFAKSQPGKLNYGSAGIGGLVHLVTDEFLHKAGISLTHVPYKGGGEYLPATASNQIQLSLADTTAAQPLVDAGKLRLLAVTSKQRLGQLPNVPTTEEAGLRGFNPSFWVGIFAPANTPQAIVDMLNREMRSILMNEEARQKFLTRGYLPVWQQPADTQRRVLEELEQLNRTIDIAKIARQ
jgi:tripartite-type tricarboxylate transporter receptor subunit TctC